MAAVRRVIYAPEICEGACLLFSYTKKGNRSFRLRHHGNDGSVEIAPEHCAGHVTTGWIDGKALKAEVAGGAPFEDAGYWRKRLLEYGEKWIGPGSGQARFNPRHVPGIGHAGGRADTGCDVAPRFPLLDLDRLRDSRKGRKEQDMARMFTSRNSEDYVTWALVCAWRRCGPGWWKAVVDLAGARAPELERDVFAAAEPEIRPWLSQPSPPAYERMSRERMRASADRSLSARAACEAPVEGESEIDLAFLSPGYVVFVEAKLRSDLSLSTTYDPSRNQLARVIDCALERAGDLPAAVWMFVRDLDPSRYSVNLVGNYQRDPGQLHRLLPHRTREQVDAICRRLALVTWGELLDALVLDDAGPEMRDVLDEVRGRI